MQPYDTLLEIFSYSYLPIERLLSKELRDQLGAELDRRRQVRLKSLYPDESLFEVADLEALQSWYYTPRATATKRNLLARLSKEVRDPKILQWLYSLRIPIDYQRLIKDTPSIALLEWLYSIKANVNYRTLLSQRPLRLEVLQFLHSIGSLQATAYMANMPLFVRLAQYAVVDDSLDILQWLTTIDPEFDYERVATLAIYEDNLPILRWASSQANLDYQELAQIASYQPNIPVLNWISSLGVDIDYRRLSDQVKSWINSKIIIKNRWNMN